MFLAFFPAALKGCINAANKTSRVISAQGGFWKNLARFPQDGDGPFPCETQCAQVPPPLHSASFQSSFQHEHIFLLAGLIIMLKYGLILVECMLLYQDVHDVYCGIPGKLLLCVLKCQESSD